MFKSFRDNRGKFSGQPGQTGANRGKPGQAGPNRGIFPGQTGASRKSSQGLVALFEIPVVHRNAKITKNSDVQRAHTSWSYSSRPCLRIELCGEKVLVSGEQRTVIKVE